MRENFRPSELYAIVKAMEKREKKAAKNRQSQAGRQFGRGKIASEKFPQAIKGRSRDKLAKIAGASGRPARQQRIRAVMRQVQATLSGALEEKQSVQ